MKSMKGISTVGWLIGVTLGLLSCSMNKDKYIAWVQDYKNELHVQQEEGEFVLDVQHTPTDYVLLQRVNQPTTLSEKKLNPFNIIR
jgi:hypothetical protein